MRTAITLAKDHKGKWAMIGDPDVPLSEQLKAWREYRGQHVHESISSILFQESDGYAQIHRMKQKPTESETKPKAKNK